MTAARRTTRLAARATVSAAVATGLCLALAACGPESGPPQSGSGSVTVTTPGTIAPGTTTPDVTTPGTTAPGATTGPSTPPSGTGSSTQTAPPTSSPTTPGDGETPPSKPTDDMLRPGDKGAQVLALQKRLSELGYWLGTPDGEFGPLTTQAVYAVQGAAGLGRDGVVGPATRKALDRGALPRVQTKGTAVEIDLSQGTLSFVKNGTPWRVLHTSTGNGAPYSTPSGTAIARTPRGTFSVQRRIDGVRVAVLGRLYRPIYFYGGYAVHGSGSIPPYPASHGCARLSNSAIDMVWRENLMPNGLPVIVHD